ncbi:MAG: hypothetical protein GY909_10630 [Oligoflexia bacterium]|nr:hypothetical protein [Oligoflexia bacterium]
MNKKLLIPVIPLLILIVIFISRFSKQSENTISVAQETTSLSNMKDEITSSSQGKISLSNKTQKENDSETNDDDQIAATDEVSQENNKEEVYTYTNFQDDIKYLQTNLPSPKEKREQVVKSDVHHIPDFLIKYGRTMAKMKRFVKENPEHSEQAFEFYQECSLNEDVFVSVRSLCLYNVLELSAPLKKQINLNKYPERVRELAKSLDI